MDAPTADMANRVSGAGIPTVKGTVRLKKKRTPMTNSLRALWFCVGAMMMWIALNILGLR